MSPAATLANIRAQLVFDAGIRRNRRPAEVAAWCIWLATVVVMLAGVM